MFPYTKILRRWRYFYCNKDHPSDTMHVMQTIRLKIAKSCSLVTLIVSQPAMPPLSRDQITHQRGWWCCALFWGMGGQHTITPMLLALGFPPTALADCLSHIAIANWSYQRCHQVMISVIFLLGPLMRWFCRG